MEGRKRGREGESGIQTAKKGKNKGRLDLGKLTPMQEVDQGKFQDNSHAADSENKNGRLDFQERLL